MRRLLSSVAIALAAMTGTARGQSQTGSERTLFLLLPTGAQAVGMGQAMVAAKPGSEGIWWNPASLADEDKKELAIHHSRTIAGTGDALTFVSRLGSYGTAGLSLNILSLGDIQVTDNSGGVVGLILPRDVQWAATYANRLSKRFGVGANYKIVQIRFDCSGQCSSVGPTVESTRAVDVGGQYEVIAGAPLTFGAAVRNLGGRLNSRQTNKRDPLPTQVEAGLRYRLKVVDQYIKDTQLHVASSFINSRSFGGKSVRLGVDLSYQEKVHLRAGFVGHDQRNDASASLGFGLQSGSFVFDIASKFGGLPGENGETPVYVSLRYLF